MKPKRWLKRLYTRNNKQWEHKLNKIECDFLKAKIACIVFWDSRSERSIGICNSKPDYLIQISRTWRLAYEAHYTEEDIMRELIKLEYPKRIAFKRSRKPKPHNGHSKKEIK